MRIDRQRDGHDEANNGFSNIAKAPKNGDNGKQFCKLINLKDFKIQVCFAKTRRCGICSGRSGSGIDFSCGDVTENSGPLKGDVMWSVGK